jgi:hypothetical protein
MAPLIAVLSVLAAAMPPPSGEVRAQLGVYRDPVRAEAHLTRLSGWILNRGDGLKLMVEPRSAQSTQTPAPVQRTLYVLSLNGFRDIQQARDYCQYIESFGQECLVVVRPVAHPDFRDD